MELASKEKFDEYVKGMTTELVGDLFARFREEQEKRATENQAGLITALTTKRVDDGVVEKGIIAARILRAMAAPRILNGISPFQYAKDNNLGSAVEKALATAPGSTGGYIVPPGYVNEIIELLYNRTAVRKLGAVSMPMPNGNLAIPKLLTGITAQYIGENMGIRAQQPTFGIIALSFKKLRATVPISNDLIRYSNPKVDEVVRNDMVNAFAVGEDAAFLKGPGSGTAPKGLDGWIPAQNTFIASAGTDLNLLIADLYKLPAALEAANVPMIRPGWIFSPRVKYALMAVRDNVGNFYFLDEMRRGTLLGMPFVSTNQVTSNTGVGNNETVVYFGDFSDAIIGESTELLIDTSTEASYLNSEGALVSAFDLDQTVLRAISRHDFAVRRDESFAKLVQVKWGAPA